MDEMLGQRLLSNMVQLARTYILYQVANEPSPMRNFMKACFATWLGTFTKILRLCTHTLIGCFLVFSWAKLLAIIYQTQPSHLRPLCSDSELESFLSEIIEANNRGVSITANASSEPNWSFGQSLFFAGTIITTIGYGRVTPLSEGGKIFCIVYASIGIPLTLIMFTALVERLMIITSALLGALKTRLGTFYKTLHIRLFHLLLIFMCLVVFTILLPAAIFSVIEDKWNYLDAFYYCFISMTTIGLGDYVPGDDTHQANRPLYKIVTTLYLFVGLTCMMLMLATIYDIPELNIGYHFYMCSDDDTDTSSTASGDIHAERTHLRGDGKPTKMYTTQDNSAFQSDIAQYKDNDEDEKP